VREAGEHVPDEGAAHGTRAVHHEHPSPPGLAQGFPDEHVVLEDPDGGYGTVKATFGAEVPEQRLRDPGARAKLVAEVGRGEGRDGESCKMGRRPETNSSSSTSAA